MEYQLDIFKNVDFPVYMLQGDSDLGQPNYLFDGSSKMEIVEEPISSFRDRFMRMNVTHKIKVTRSEQLGIYSGPEKFFPKSSFVKFKFLKDVGHFVHLEAPQETVNALKELLAVRC
jgi:pimeloyl-ACP methyl ester carboxylesterase